MFFRHVTSSLTPLKQRTNSKGSLIVYTTKLEKYSEKGRRGINNQNIARIANAVFLGLVMSSHHSDQMSQRSQVSRASL